MNNIKPNLNPWDEKFSGEEFFYGKTPNEYFKTIIEKLIPGKALFPAEGEGRNAVFAARLGWEVTAYDGSTEGQKKARLLAAANNVNIVYKKAYHEEFSDLDESYDLIVLVFAHSNNRSQYHKKLLSYLKPGGKLLLEGFSKEQINYTSGGPKSLDLLFSEEELKADFDEMHELYVNSEIVELSEGEHHKGKASVIRVYGVK
jgi:SAM-dependent methyltransferase